MNNPDGTPYARTKVAINSYMTEYIKFHARFEHTDFSKAVLKIANFGDRGFQQQNELRPLIDALAPPTNAEDKLEIRTFKELCWIAGNPPGKIASSNDMKSITIPKDLYDTYCQRAKAEGKSFRQFLLVRLHYGISLMVIREHIYLQNVRAVTERRFDDDFLRRFEVESYLAMNIFAVFDDNLREKQRRAESNFLGLGHLRDLKIAETNVT